MEIHNLYSIDIFLQGMFLMLCVFLGLYIVFNDNLENFRNSNTVSQWSRNFHKLAFNTFDFLKLGFLSKKSEGDYSTLGVIPVVVISSFILGILGHSIADSWIDSSNFRHLYSKPLWAGHLIEYDKLLKEGLGEEIDSESVLPYKSLLRYKAFRDVFGKNEQKPTHRIVEQLYFHSKHQIIKDSNYSAYVRKSQSMAEYSRVFALGFFFLVLCGFVNLVIMIVRAPFINDDKTVKEPSKDEEKGELNKEKDNKIQKKELKSGNYKLLTVPNLIIFLFNLVSLLAIWFFVKPEFGYLINPFHAVFLFPFVFIGCFTFLLNIWEKYRVLRFSFFLYSIIYVISILGYFSSTKNWLASERQVALKVFGIYKSKHISPDVEELKYMREILGLNLGKKVDSIWFKSQVSVGDSIYRND